jgi:LacI family transcriptional regulator
LSKPDLVRETTRERILKAAKEIAYHPNRAARSLITGKTGNLGVIVPDLDNPFYPSVVRGVQARAHQAGYALLLGDSGEDAAAEQNLVHTMAKQVDGVILCAPFSSDAQVARLTQAVSLVLVNRRLRNVPAVLMDAAHGMRQVIDHLLSLGHRSCAFLSGPLEAWSNRERRRGLHAAVRAHAMELHEFGPFEPKFAGGVQGADLALAAGISAIVAFNDLMALGVLSRLAARGIRVPEDISVVGCDDVLYAAMCAPPLTTVAMPMEEAGRVAVDLLLSQYLEDAGRAIPFSQTKLPTNLIVRATTAAPTRRGVTRELPTLRSRSVLENPRAKARS